MSNLDKIVKDILKENQEKAEITQIVIDCSLLVNKLVSYIFNNFEESTSLVPTNFILDLLEVDLLKNLVTGICSSTIAVKILIKPGGWFSKPQYFEYRFRRIDKSYTEMNNMDYIKSYSNLNIDSKDNLLLLKDELTRRYDLIS